VTALF